VFGLARNARRVAEIEAELARAEAEAVATGKPARRFKDFRSATFDSWSRRRRVIGKAEWTRGEANPRFVVTSLKEAETNRRFLYEKVCCARGEMENRIKECQGDLFADRTSTATLRANHLRLWFVDVLWLVERVPGGRQETALGDTARAATSHEVKGLRREAQALKEVVADLPLENRLLKKSMIGDGGDEA
jgi:Transposase DDE domain group 1